MSTQGGKEGQPQPVSLQALLALDDGEFQGLPNQDAITETIGEIAGAANRQEALGSEKDMLHTMGQFEQSSKLFGGFCVTVGKENDRALIFRTPKVRKTSADPDQNGVYWFTIEYLVMSKKGLSCAMFKDGMENPEQMDELIKPDPYAAESISVHADLRRFHEYLRYAARIKNMQVPPELIEDTILSGDPGALNLYVYHTPEDYYDLNVEAFADSQLKTIPVRSDEQFETVREILTGVRSQINDSIAVANETQRLAQEMVGTYPQKRKHMPELRLPNFKTLFRR